MKEWNKWSEAECQKIIEFYPYLSVEDLLEKLPNRTLSQIKDKARHLKVKSLSGKRSPFNRIHLLDNFEDVVICYWWDLLCQMAV